MADYDYQRIQYNTVVSTCMKMLNALESATLPNTAVAQRALAETTSLLLRVLYPVVTHITWRLWQDLGYDQAHGDRSEEHTSEIQSLMRISYTVFCLKKITNKN